MRVDSALLDRAGDLKAELLAFSRQPRYEKAFRGLIGRRKRQSMDSGALMQLQDRFVLQHRLKGGRTVVEEFVAERPDLSERDREMLLAWGEVVQQPYEVLRRDRSALVLEGLVDEMIYRVPTTVLQRDEESVACEIAIDLTLRDPELVFRNPDKLETAWELQRGNRDRFIRLFGADLVGLRLGPPRRRPAEAGALEWASSIVRPRHRGPLDYLSVRS